MDYQALHFQINPELNEILIAELSELGYESFLENEHGFSAYLPFHLFDEESIINLQQTYQENIHFTYTHEFIKAENWNAKWEADYAPVIIENQCLIKSSFHQIDTEYPYQILINPKMSFGTGHHDTTALMITHLLDTDLSGKTVLDAGCGTGILAIMAHKRGAVGVKGFDIEEWAVENAQENITLNNCPDIQIWLGTIETVAPHEKFDCLIANIQRNVLLAEMHLYAQHLNSKGILFVSGFYEADIEDLVQEAGKYSLQLDSKKISPQSWTALKFLLN